MTTMLTVLLRTFVSIIGILPVRLRSFIGAAFGALFSLIPTHERKIVVLQRRRFLGTKAGIREVASVYAAAGQTLFETMNLAPMIRDMDRYIQCDTPEVMANIASGNEAVIFLTGHTGNWDLLGAFVINNKIPLTTAAREARNPALQAVLKDIRANYGINSIWRSGRVGLKELIREIQGKRAVSALIDQDTRVTSVLARFFGVPVRTPSAIVELGKKHQARFFSIFIFRIALARYRVVVEAIPESLSTEEILVEYNRRLENYLYQYPEQWVWFHKRWRSLPDGTRMSSREYLEFLSQQPAAR